jgi:N-methylhydantoinase A
MTLRLGVDIGGTFTDFALFNEASGAITVHKQLTTPHDPADSVLSGIDAVLAKAGAAIGAVTHIVHGTTLVTNAVIERKGAPIGMLVTKGFGDVLEIGMERRFDLFDLRLKYAAPVVPRANRIEVDERIRYDGSVEVALDLAAARAGVAALAPGIEAVAVCLINAFANPAHEHALADMIRSDFPALHVCASADIVPFMREFERWTTTTINAYTQPLMDRYLGRLESELAARGFGGAFLIMTSSGGTVPTEFARRYPARLTESGPAAGVLMSAFIGAELGLPHLLAFDMGGTTAKGAFVQDAQPVRKYETEIARVHNHKPGSGLVLRTPVIDLIEIGAGGGSIAGIDERGLMKVGPRSAGAMPGPVCYGQGGENPTLTDANLLLGYLDPRFFLGGEMSLDVAGAEKAAASKLGGPLKLDAARTAWGIHEIINEDVARAFRMHASELGLDYRGCTMVAFGGSGPLHALRIARKLRIPRVVLPSGAGVFSAVGLLVSPLSFETLRSFRVRLAEVDTARMDAVFAPLAEQATAVLRHAGLAEADIRIERRLDLRFAGQGHELTVTLPDGAGPGDVPALFVARYKALYSDVMPDTPIEVVNWKLEATGPRPQLATAWHIAGGGDAEASALKGTRRAYFDDPAGYVDCPVYDRYRLRTGQQIAGPALIEERESTCVLGPGDIVTVDARGNLIATVGGPHRSLQMGGSW